MKRTIVLVVASLHGLHKENPAYGYEQLFEVIADFEPDFVGVEIRPEDLGADDEYLGRNYPFEMVELVRRYGVARCFGFDWLGDDIAERPIPENYWREISEFKRVERALNADDTLENGTLDELFEEQMAIATEATAGSLVDGRYGAVTKRYYEVMGEWLAGTDYELIPRFRERRDAEIGRWIVDFVRKHAGARIALVMGANHHVFAVEALEQGFEGEDLVLVGM